MTSQSQIEDEILAKRLQAEEFQAANSRQPVSRVNSHDEEYARRLAAEERSARPAVTNKPLIKLHQTATGRQIGETLIVNSFGPEEIALELSNRRGYFLRIRDTGAVEFNIPPNGMIIDSFRFRVITLSNGSCFLMSKAFLQSTNRTGGRGWHLTILPDGQLCGNGARDSFSEWALMNLQTQMPLHHPASLPTPAVQYVASTYPPAPAAAQSTPAPTQFPGLGAGKDELMRYFSTPAGIQFLNQPEYLPAFELYQRNGLLSRLLHRPDWPFLATNFRDFFSEPIRFQKTIADNAITFDGLKQFFEKGWAIVSNVTTQEAVSNAKKIVNYWQYKYLSQPNQGNNGVRKQRGYGVECTGDIAWDQHLLALYYQSPLPHIMQQLFGADEVDNPKFCRPVLIYPSLDLTESPALFGDKWSIDGFVANPPSHSPYNILIGVALTDINDIDMGNFCVHSGSHVILLEEYKAKAEQRSTLFSDNPYSVTKPDLGPPTQLKLKAGDAFFCTQRLATLFATNTSASPTMFAFFEISHVDHAVLKDPALQSMWLEYKNATFYLGDENAGIVTTRATVVQSVNDYNALIDVSTVNLHGGQQPVKATATVASPPTSTVVSATPYAPAGIMVASAYPTLPGNIPNAQSPPQQQQQRGHDEDFAPAMNPMFTSGTAGYNALPTVDEDYGPERPSNHIPLQTFGSNSNNK